MQEIQRSLGRIEGSLESIHDDIAEMTKDLKTQNGRLSKVENRVHWYSGFAAALGALLGIGSSHIPRL